MTPPHQQREGAAARPPPRRRAHIPVKPSDAVPTWLSAHSSNADLPAGPDTSATSCREAFHDVPATGLSITSLVRPRLSQSNTNSPSAFVVRHAHLAPASTERVSPSSPYAGCLPAAVRGSCISHQGTCLACRLTFLNVLVLRTSPSSRTAFPGPGFQDGSSTLKNDRRPRACLASGQAHASAFLQEPSRGPLSV